jgi:hypothetical protein
MQYIESNIKDRYANEIEDVYIGDTRPLFEGSVKLKDAINKNIGRFIQSKTLILWGVKTNITVTTKQGMILYPASFDDKEGSFLQPDPMKVASDNYNFMNEGLEINVDVILEHNTLLSNAILTFYICVTVLVLFLYYRAGVNKAKQEEMEKSSKIARLLELEENYANNVKSLERERENLKSEVFEVKKGLESEKMRASRNEDEMIQEIVLLEEKIDNNIALQKEKQEEIDALREKIKRFEKGRRKDSKQKTKSFDSAQKRFKTLYKNITVNERAISGFIDLEDDLKIKSEEIIHKLNENPEFVQIKRKVFGKKSRKTVQEVIYAYKGRLYFRKTKDNRIEILTIGTKNTQSKDLEFLDKL